MSEKVLYCGKDDYIRTSSQIIRNYYLHRQNFLFPNEISVLKRYYLYETIYMNLSSNLITFGIYPKELTRSQTESLIEEYKNKLSAMEDSTEMRNFFNRIEEKDFIMSYGNKNNK